MIERISLANFKCFEALDLDLAPLTLLTGFNAGGKSTAIQTLLLLEQTLRGSHNSPDLILNGPSVNLGSPAEILNVSAGAKSIMLGASSGEVQARWHFEVPEDRRRLRISFAEIDGELKSAEELEGIRPSQGIATPIICELKHLIYLGAGRQIDTEVFPSPAGPELRNGDVGTIGEFAAWWLHEMGDQDCKPTRRHPDATGQLTIRQQVNAWISDLFPGAEANAVPLQQTNLLRLELRCGVTSDWVRPANIGYGVSYAFPIIVAGLCADENGTVILDSPEAHLHPRSQSRIGRFLAQIGGAGVQMLVETHSDHVLNGVRIAVRDGLIRPDDTAIYFFSSRADARVTRLSVDRYGTIHDLPDGFFDQAERDLSNLAGWTL